MSYDRRYKQRIQIYLSVSDQAQFKYYLSLKKHESCNEPEMILKNLSDGLNLPKPGRIKRRLKS